MDVKLDVSSVTIETPRLRLRPWRQGDLDAFFAYARVPGVGEMAGWPHHKTTEDTQRVLDMFLREKNVFALADKQTDTVMGSLGLHASWANEKPEYAPYHAKELGYALCKTRWGRGYMPEAVRAVVKYLFERRDLQLLTLSHFDFNAQSRRVIEKCGFTYVETADIRGENPRRELRYILFKE